MSEPPNDNDDIPLPDGDDPEIRRAEPQATEPALSPPQLPVVTSNAPNQEPKYPWYDTPLPLPGQGSLDDSQDRNWAMWCHLAAFGGLLVPSLGNIIGPLIIWAMKRHESPFVDAHGKESINFQISLSLYLWVGGGVTGVISFLLSLLVCFGFIGVALLSLALIALAIFGVVYQIIGALRASEGGFLRYPLSIRFLR